MLATVFVGVYWPNLRRLVIKTAPYYGEPNWQHSMLVPLIGLYYLYLNRDALAQSQKAKPLGLLGKSLGVWAQIHAMIVGILAFLFIYGQSVVDSHKGLWMAVVVGSNLAGLAVMGLAIRAGIRPKKKLTGLQAWFDRMAESSSLWFGAYCLMWGLVFYSWAIYPGQNDFFKDSSMVATLFGMSLTIWGWRVMKIAWFPIFFLLCAIPWPGLMYSKIAMPLQELAAKVAAWTLQATGVEAVKVGTRLNIGEGANVRVLNVAEACAGLKSLMTFISAGAAIAFLSNRALWQKIIISCSAVPIAILCNVFRVTGQGLIDHYWSHEFAEGFAHQFVGLVMLIPAFFLILMVGWILDNLFMDEVDRKTKRGKTLNAGGRVIEIPAGGKPAAGPKASEEMAQAARRLAGMGKPPQTPQTTTEAQDAGRTSHAE